MTRLSEPQLEASNADPGLAAKGSYTVRLADALRPLAVSAAVAAAVVLADMLGPHSDPWNPLVRYGLRTTTIGAALIGLLAYLWCRRKGQTWDADLIAGLWGGLGAFTILVALKGTPFAPLGIFGDQSFRTEAITRFADHWYLADYFYQGKPSYYAPGYFWILGRLADLLGMPPWQMLKVGLVGAAFLAPVLMYLLWRRHVPLRVAALLAGVALVVEDFYEPYGWIIFAAIVPWWIEVMHGPQRKGATRVHPILLGLIGAAMFCTYYYYFFVLPFFLVVHLVLQRVQGRIEWAQIRRSIGILAMAAAGSSFFWLPMAWNFITAREFASLNNRWLMIDHGDLALPMFEMSVKGMLCLFGLAYLILSAQRKLVSSTLLTLFIALYAWHATGFFLAAAGMPVMSFRMKHLVPLLLLAAAVIGLAELAKLAARRFDAGQTAKLVTGIGVLLALFAGDRYVSTLSDHEWVRAAHNTPLPDGQLPRWHDQDKKPVSPSAEVLRRAIDSRFYENRNPVIFSSRIDLYSFYPYYGFVQWTFAYSHPTAEFENRLAFLRNLSGLTPAEFADRTANNPHDRIDAFVLYLEDEGKTLRFYYSGQNFPAGAVSGSIALSREQINEAHFDIVVIENILVAVRK